LGLHVGSSVVRVCFADVYIYIYIYSCMFNNWGMYLNRQLLIGVGKGSERLAYCRLGECGDSVERVEASVYEGVEVEIPTRKRAQAGRQTSWVRP
jgi:hypothetical protein